jgi:hypothetical protein
LTGAGEGRGGEENLKRVTALVQAHPIRWAEGDAGGTEDDVIARGWFEGADECARILAARTGLEVIRGGGFGSVWPLLRGMGCVLSPALPVAVCEGSATGPDGEYSVDATGVWREAIGARELYLASTDSRSAPGTPFDLLWFGEVERFLVRDRLLEIEDLFGTLRVPASKHLLDRLLIHGRRFASDLLASLPLAATQGQQVIEVRRPAVLSSDDQWRDATRFLATRADVDDVRRRGVSIHAQVAGGVAATFDLEDGPAGWSLTLRAGDYVLKEIRLNHVSNTLRLCATLDPRIDALRPGMRSRLIFDLRSDLVALG